MKRIAIISSSVRKDRLSHRIALFIKNVIDRSGLAQAEVLDLKAYNFPLFEERLAYMDNPSDDVLDFAERFNNADGIIIVSPVYNASFPAALKNVIDLFVKEWRDKVAAVCTVTNGTNAGIATSEALQALLLKVGAFVVPIMFNVLSAGIDYQEDGTSLSPEHAEKFVAPLINKLHYMIDNLK